MDLILRRPFLLLVTTSLRESFLNYLPLLIGLLRLLGRMLRVLPVGV